MVSGLSSVGLHELFTQLIEGSRTPVVASQDMIDEAQIKATVREMEEAEKEEE